MIEANGLFQLDERRCGTCKEVRPLGDFYTATEERNAAARGVQRVLRKCRFCQRETNTRRRAPRVAILDAIKTEAGCADCGIRDSEHPEIYDFDHLPGQQKTIAVSRCLTRGTVEQMLAEVAKCEVVCSNCHRIWTRRARAAASFGHDRGPRRA